MAKKIFFRSVVFIAVIVSAASCTLQQPVKTESKYVPSSFNGSTDSLTSAKLSWREYFSDPYLSALIEIGLALFLLTVIVNAIARLLVWSTTRGVPARVHAQ